MLRASASILYLVSYMIVLGLMIFVIDTVERQWVLHTWYRKGDVDATAACLVLGAVFFPMATLLMAKLERLEHPRLTDHLRQCVGVYALVIATSSYLISANAEQRDGLGYGLAAGACLLGIYAAAVNGLVLWLGGRYGQRNRSAAGN